jgi:hypothetical protein
MNFAGVRMMISEGMADCGKEELVAGSVLILTVVAANAALSA